MTEKHSELASIREERSSFLEDVNVAIGASGADEHSLIAQADAAITPGSKTPVLHLIGTSRIPQALQGEYSYLIGSAFADLELLLPDLPIENLEFGATVALANLQVSNSVGGRNQDTKAKMINGIGQIARAGSKFGRRRNGYESDEGS